MSEILPEIVNIPQHAIDELRAILEEDIGDADIHFTDEDLHGLGEFLLTLTALVKHRRTKRLKKIDY